MRIYLFLLTFGLVFFQGIRGDVSLPSPYDTVELLPYNPQGWYSNGKAIKELFAEKNPMVVVEVGCWMGVSTMDMASLLPSDGIIYAVDHWKGSEEHQPGEQFWNPILPKLYEQFLSNVIHRGLCDKIIPVRMGSLEASQVLAEIKADIVYIDAAHDYESVYADLNAWYPLVKENGVLCGDDFPHPPIQRALYQFAQEQGLRVLTVPDTRFFYLVKELKGKPIPIQFSIPESKVIKSIPHKDRDFAFIIPGKSDTYIYSEEENYYKGYQRSLYAITCKKAGWDCMRHYEILANGCIPYFLDLDQCDEKTMPFLPRELIKKAMNLEGVSYLTIDHSKFDRLRYNEILTELLEHTRKHLTTKQMSKYLLEKVGYRGNGKILYLSQDPAPDYLRCLTLIGLKENFQGRVVDFPKITHIYKSYPGDIKALYGKGISYTKILDDIPVDRKNIRERILKKEFDLVIFGSVHRGMPFHSEVLRLYKPEEVVYICGEDLHICGMADRHNFFLRESEAYFPENLK